MNREYRVVWQWATPWDDEDGATIYGDSKWRIYQVEYAAKRMLKFLTTPCGTCPICAPREQSPWDHLPSCPASNRTKAWIEVREVGEWHEAG